MAVATAPTSATPDADPGTPLASSRTPRPPFQLTRRLVGATRWPLFLLTAIYALNVTDQYVVPTLFPLLKQEFGLSDSALGVLSSSYVIVVTLGTVPFGYFADRMRRTRRDLLGHRGVGRDDDLDRSARGTTPACSARG